MKSGFLLVSVLLALTAGCSSSDRPPRDTLGSGNSGNGASGGTSVGNGGNVGLINSGGAGGSSDVSNGTCAQVNFQTKRRPTEVLLLLDRSASMNEHEISTGVTRWQGVVSGVEAALTATDAKVDWGLKTFPESSGNQCLPSSVTSVIDVQIAPANAATVNAQIDKTTPAGDGTPTGDAEKQAAAYLATRNNDNQKLILLATDGEPSCADLSTANGSTNSTAARDWAVQQVTAAATAGFQTIVLGVLDPNPSNTTLDTLNRMAIAGGRPAGNNNPLANAFYLATNSTELSTALNEITGAIASCTFPFDKAPPDPTNIAVKVNSVKVPEDDTKADGWAYVDANHRGVTLYGSWCQQIQSLSDNQIEFIFGCPGVPIR